MTVVLITKNITQINGATADNIYTGVSDVHLRMNTPTTNYGTLNQLNIFKVTSDNHYHGLIRFDDLSNIPSNAIVSAASLYIKVRTDDTPHTHDLSLRRMLQPWTEAGATWSTYDGTNAWNTDGALGAGTDRVETEVSITNISVGIAYKELDCTSIVQDIVDGTIASDEGFHLERTDVGNDGNVKTWFSSEASSNDRPELLVTYTLAAGATATLTGTVTTSITEADIQAGGDTIIIQLTGDTFLAAGTAFDDQRQAIIDGLNGV